MSSLIPTSLILASLAFAPLLSAYLVPASLALCPVSFIPIYAFFVLASLNLIFPAPGASMQSFLATSPALASLALISPISPAPTSPAPTSLALIESLLGGTVL